MAEMTAEDIRLYEEWDDKRMKTISNQIVEFFPQVMIFHTLIVSMCVLRSPTDFAVSCTLFAMIIRVVMVIGYYANKKIIWIGAGAIEVFINFMLLFICMGYS